MEVVKVIMSSQWLKYSITQNGILQINGKVISIQYKTYKMMAGIKKTV